MQRMNYNELLFILTDTKNPAHSKKEIMKQQAATSTKKGKVIQESAEAQKILKRVYNKYLSVGDGGGSSETNAKTNNDEQKQYISNFSRKMTKHVAKVEKEATGNRRQSKIDPNRRVSIV